MQQFKTMKSLAKRHSKRKDKDDSVLVLTDYYKKINSYAVHFCLCQIVSKEYLFLNNESKKITTFIKF